MLSAQGIVVRLSRCRRMFGSARVGEYDAAPGPRKLLSVRVDEDQRTHDCTQGARCICQAFRQGERVQRIGQQSTRAISRTGCLPAPMLAGEQEICRCCRIQAATGWPVQTPPTDCTSRIRPDSSRRGIVTASSPPQPDRITLNLHGSLSACLYVCFSRHHRCCWFDREILAGMPRSGWLCVTGIYSQEKPFLPGTTAAIRAYSPSGEAGPRLGRGGDQENTASSGTRSRRIRGKPQCWWPTVSRPPLRWEPIGNAERRRHVTDWRKRNLRCSAQSGVARQAKLEAHPQGDQIGRTISMPPAVEMSESTCATG